MDGELVALFTALPVEELQKLVRRKRHDIERKKDELRHLVGERHRDVIEASDAIQEMKFLTVKVSESVIALRDRCTALDVPPQIISMYVSNFMPTRIHRDTRSSESLKIDPSVAAHLKLLLDIPEMIWNFMDNADHVSAVILFFFGRHIAARLQLSTHTYSAGIDARVLVKRLWNSLLHMESAVLAACRRRLNAPPSNWRELCSSLVAIILMENMPLCKALDELLEGRMVSETGF
ncbi:hypothetical protein FGIG_11983 [Fasciola gigantica]|uniref:Conserved oligomeric Golgi complex subunit 1 n=1 Tax=Fasciola gigantica TaxID=46835 RepID=A0A504YI72_FASGI|nr:hypothetical protein FGIG_11983 [Fasciola gigantica]